MKLFHKLAVSAATVVAASVLFAAPALANLTISSATQFSALLLSGDNDGSVPGCFTYAGGDLIISNAGSILNNDPASPSGNSAGAICVNVTAGQMIMQTGSSVSAQNTVQSGSGGNISITSTGSLVMEPGATITSSKTAGSDGGKAGNITLTVTNADSDITIGGAVRAESINMTQGPFGGNGGNIVITAPDDVTIEEGGLVSSTNHSGGSSSAGNITIDATGPEGDITVEQGGAVRADSISRAGDIFMTATRYLTVDGTVSSGRPTSGNQNTGGRGGVIWLESGCTLTIGDSGIVTSNGRDPGADLVHLQGCDVYIYGLIESTGPGHAPGNPPGSIARRCYDANGGNTADASRPDKSPSSTACIEVWAGGDLVIDNTGTHNGQLNADIAQSGGNNGRSWIDLIARGDITLVGDQTGVFLVHANQPSGTNGSGGAIKVQSQTGDVTASGLVLQADMINGGGVGGSIKIQADDNITLDGANLFARGDNVATFGFGGKIGTGSTPGIQAMNGTISWKNGVGNVTPTGTNAQLPAANRGEIILQDCTAAAANLTGSTFPNNGTPATTPLELVNACGGLVTLASYVQLPPECEDCTTGSLRVFKFIDEDGNASQNGGEGPHAGVSFTITGPGGYNNTVQTDANGEIVLTGLEPGDYTITETVPSGYHSTTGSSANVSVTIGNQSSATFGNQKDVGSLHILKFEDSNGDGDQDGGENPLAGVSFIITGPNGYDSGPLQTDANGEITLNGLDAGAYTATETVPTGYSPTTLTVQNGAVTHATTTNLTFGNQKDVGSLRILKFIDTNGNASQDGGEGPHAGVSFTITGPGGYNNTVQTDANGEITITGLAPGSYTVTETVPSGYHSTTGSSASVNVVVNTQANATFGNDEDEVEPEFGGLRILKFIDTNGNASQDGGEGPHAGVSFTITGPGGYNNTVQTDSSGEIVLTGLEPGAYVVTETVPSGYHSTTGSSQNVTVVVNSQVTATFGNDEDEVEPSPTPPGQQATPDPTPTPPGQQATPDPSSTPGIQASTDSGSSSSGGTGTGFTPSTFANTSEPLSAQQLLITLGLLSLAAGLILIGQKRRA